jgi:NADH-quinone oxidoreductase subunit G
MPTIYIENQPYDIPAGQNMLHACLSLRFDLPYFCWHPGMHSVGSCRQCAVKHFKDESDTEGRIEMACMLHADDGVRISIRDEEAAEFRAAVTELLMTNHPHDCPVCDEGGECHLQDMTVMTGHNYRRYRFGKRTHLNQDLGPLINHEMNRCIACYRCLRFYREYAGGRDLNVFQSHNFVYFGRHEDGVLESEFSGNLVEVCPTGVFTDKTLKRHYARKWDLQTAPSVCVHCGVGCNTTAGERYGTLRRIRNRYNSQVNGYWLCDRGRFGYEFVNHGRRIRRPLVRLDDGQLAPVDRDAALRRAAESLADADCVIGIGSPRASLEANFALRQLVGAEQFSGGTADHQRDAVARVLEILRRGPVRTPSLQEMGHADATLILGEDISNTAPMTAMAVRRAALRKEIDIANQLNIPAWQDAAVREAIQQQRGPVFIATPASTRLDDLGTRIFRGAPSDIARLGYAVAHALHDQAPPVTDLPPEVVEIAETIAADLRGAGRPLVVSGTSLASEAILQAAANVAWALHAEGVAGELSYVVPECNSLGIGLMGGEGVEAAAEQLRSGRRATLIVLENDLYRRGDAAAIDELLDAAEHVMVIDHLHNRTSARADVVLPAATFAEGDGTLVNNEGRAQRFYQVFMPDGEVTESWRWLRDLATASGRDVGRGWRSLDDVAAAIAAELPVFADLPETAPPAEFRIREEKVPRQPHRYSGRTAMHADVSVHEPQTPSDPDSPLAYSMEGYQGQPPPPLIPRYWSPGWNSVQALNKFQEEVGGMLTGGDPGCRLIEPADGRKGAFFRDAPEPFAPCDDRWLVAPLYHVFGSDELSVLSPGVAQLAPEPYVAVSPDDARRLDVQEGDELELVSDRGAAHRLKVRIAPELVRGLAGVSAGLPQTAAVVSPGWFSLGKVSES